MRVSIPPAAAELVIPELTALYAEHQQRIIALNEVLEQHPEQPINATITKSVQRLRFNKFSKKCSH